MSDPWRVVRHERVDSTNERALSAIAAGEALHGEVHVARVQTSGRGRRGSRWESNVGEGLYASYVLFPSPPGPPAPLVTMSAGLALLDAVRELGLTHVRLDWPNDMNVGAAKLAGILVETRGLAPERPHLVVGIGLNVRQTSFSPELEGERPVTSLLREGLDVSVERALEHTTRALQARWKEAELHPEGVPAKYLEAAGLARAAVHVEHAAGNARGRILALDLRRGMSLETDDGRTLQLALEHVRAVVPV